MAEAETFWTNVKSVFAIVDDNDSTVATTAEKTTYTIQDAIGNYDNDAAGTEWVVNADVRVITGTAEEIYQAQIYSSNESHNIFSLVNNSTQDRLIITTGSDSSQTIVGGPGSNTIYVGNGDDVVTGGVSGDTINGGAGYDTLNGGAGNDNIDAGADNDTVYGGTGGDQITGGDGYDHLYGNEGRDTIFAGSSSGADTAADWIYRSSEYITGGRDGDNMFGSTNADIFSYEGSSRSELNAESGTTANTRDYITNFSSGDTIRFDNFTDSDVLFFGSGSANAGDDKSGLSIRYETNINVTDWDGTTKTATRILIDIADDVGGFDDIADMHIILLGDNLDINWDGSSIVFGG